MFVVRLPMFLIGAILAQLVFFMAVTMFLNQVVARQVNARGQQTFMMRTLGVGCDLKP